MKDDEYLTVTEIIDFIKEFCKDNKITDISMLVLKENGKESLCRLIKTRKEIGTKFYSLDPDTEDSIPTIHGE